jgi:hypothetical protein
MPGFMSGWFGRKRRFQSADLRGPPAATNVMASYGQNSKKSLQEILSATIFKRGMFS